MRDATCSRLDELSAGIELNWAEQRLLFVLVDGGVFLCWLFLGFFVCAGCFGF